MFQDEGRFGRVSLPRRSWAPLGMRPVCHTQIIREYTYAYSAISPVDGMMGNFNRAGGNDRSNGNLLAASIESFPG